MTAKPASNSPGSSPDSSSPELAALYEEHTETTRRYLRRFGAVDQDLDDLVQEVFLVLHAKPEVLNQVAPLDPWLREVCRRVAAGDRRRAHRRREIAFGEPPDTAGEPLFDQALEKGEQEELLHRALGQLDEQSRDLLALHELGSLPLVDVAKLVEADRKTVRKRLSTALRRLTTLLSAPTSKPLVTSSARLASPNGPRRSGEAFRVLASHPAINVGMVGSVVLAVWPGPATLEALELLDVQFQRAVEICHGGFAYLTVVEANARPPDLKARQKIVSLLRAHAHHIGAYAIVMHGGASWIARPIMTGLAFLVRPPFPMQFFNAVPTAARWLVDSHPGLTHTSAAAIIESTEKLRT